MPTISDDFERSNQNLAGSQAAEGWYWSPQLRSGRSTSISGGKVGGDGGTCHAESSVATNASASIIVSGTGGGVLARCHATNRTGYMFSHSNVTGWTVWKYSGSAFSVLDSIAGSVVANDVLTIECDGDTIRGLVNDIEVISVSDLSYTTGDQCGVYATSAVVESFSAEPLEASVSGEVQWYVAYGQSNGAGRGSNNQDYLHPTLPAYKIDASDLPQLLADPTGIDVGAAGSVWPVMANYIAATTDNRVGIVNKCRGGQTIAQLSKGNATGYYSDMIDGASAAVALSGEIVKLCWWQGENDVTASTTMEVYRDALIQLAADVMADLGAVTVPCLLQNATGLDQTKLEAIREGTRQAAASSANIDLGPDFSDLETDDTVHLQSDASLQVAGLRWAQSVLGVSTANPGNWQNRFRKLMIEAGFEVSK